MAEGARRVLGSDVGLSITGVAGPDPRTDQPWAPSSSAWPDRAMRPRRSASPCPATGTGSASTPPSPRSTSCAGRCAPRPATRLPRRGGNGLPVASGGRRGGAPGRRRRRGRGRGGRRCDRHARRGELLPGVAGLQGDRDAARAVSVAGWVRVDRLQVPVMATPSRSTSRGPVPVAVTSTSWPPSLFSTQGPMSVGTVMTTTLVAAVWRPVEQLVRRARVGAQVGAGRGVPLPGHVGRGGEGDVHAASPIPGTVPAGGAAEKVKIGAGGVTSPGTSAHSAAVLVNVE